MTRLIVCFALVAMAGPLSAQTCEATGDVDCSGGLTIGDLALIIDFFDISRELPPCPWEMDVNSDCMIDRDDFAILIACLDGPNPDCPVVTTCCEPEYKLTCCDGLMRGDVNLSSLWENPDIPTIGDVSAMIEAKFIADNCIGPDPYDPIIACLDEADVNLSAESYPVTCEGITVGDISLIVDYLFITGPTGYGGSFPTECPDGASRIPTGECPLAPCPVYGPVE